MNAYQTGFMAKCAELGIDPVVLVKSAGPLGAALSRLGGKYNVFAWHKPSALAMNPPGRGRELVYKGHTTPGLDGHTTALGRLVKDFRRNGPVRAIEDVIDQVQQHAHMKPSLLNRDGNLPLPATAAIRKELLGILKTRYPRTAGALAHRAGRPAGRI